ncbi:MAG: FtsX-like permease family protein, partial [Bacteroidota bacterium]
FFGEDAMNNVGGNYNWMTFIRVSPNTNIDALEQQANDEFWDKYIGSFRNGLEARDFYDFDFQPMLDIHLKSDLEGEYETNGSLQQVYIFSIIGILLLLVACVNYMNLATSHYSRRMKEVGVRKVIGAFRSSLIKQFLTESILITFISFPFCIILIIWALPYLNDFMEKQLEFNLISEINLLGSMFLLLIGVGVLAGMYPAIFLSKMRLVDSLKGEQTQNASKWNFRSFLVTFQYAVTIALIFAIVVIDGQMKFIRNSNPGYQREQVLSLSIPRDSNLETFKNELLDHPNILSASYSTRIPTGRLADSWGSRFFENDSSVSTSFRLPIVSVDPDFLKTYEIDLVAGENFREGYKTVLISDSLTTGHYIINETATKAFGFENPAEIIGYKIGYGPTQGRIIGVMADFHFESLHSEIVPMLIMYRENYRRISLKLREDEVRSTLDFIENTYAKFDTEQPANYNFVDDLFNDQYQNEERLSTMIKVFAFIAILIGCLGLIGMVGFVIETKIKEIGVRKVLGASTRSIWLLISNRFLILIGIAFLISLPVAYFLMTDWLEAFVYRANISILNILLPAILTIGLTLLAISYQTLRATKVNPVECLKDE